mgnify:CR=1 FL=1
MRSGRQRLRNPRKSSAGLQLDISTVAKRRVICPLDTRSSLELGFQPTKGGGMARKRYTAEAIIGHLRTIEIELGKVTSPHLLGHLHS